MNFDYLFRSSYMSVYPVFTGFSGIFRIGRSSHIFLYLLRCISGNLNGISFVRFDFVAVRSHSKVANANRMRLHMLPTTYSIASDDWHFLQICESSNCPYKKELYTTLENIQQLTVQLE